ncbi:MAG TPA: lytic murein transglycosylase [Solirubrobacteraceae bacterium]|nr:lytic murein transglycosylase [Solirubrobacteraceae bacterium]
MTSQQLKGTKGHASRKRFVAALCTAGLVAGALGGNLLAADAQEQPPVPGEQVAGPPTQISSDARGSSPLDPTTTSTTSTTATTPTETTTATTPADPTTTDPAPTTTTPDPAAGDPPADVPAVPVPAIEDPAAPAAPAPAATDTAPEAAPPAAAPAATAPLPVGVFAGPAVAQCPTPAKKARTDKKGAPVATFSGGGATTVEPAEDCDKGAATPKTTISPDRVQQDEPPAAPLRNDQGVPTVANPTTSLSLPGPVPVGVPNFFIDKFRIPPFLLPIYQAAGIQYGVRWEVLAAINEIETDYGRNLNISSAGALGWMQFMPQTWEMYGVDANRDGRKDPFNPVDAIFAAARYLKAAGADTDLRKAIFAYNHADWYVESVLMRARLIGGLPTDLVGSLSGLTQGHFPVFAKARYADDISERQAALRVAAGTNAANPVEPDSTRRGVDIFAEAGAPVIAVQDGTITAVGESARLGRYVKLRDAYGNTYTYGHLKKVATRVPVPKPKTQSKASIAKELALPGRHDPAPTVAATAGTQSAGAGKTVTGISAPAVAPDAAADPAAFEQIRKERLFAHPSRPNALANGGAEQILELESAFAADASLKSYFTGVYGLDPSDVVLKPLAVGRRVIAGTILGRIGQTSEKISPRLYFEIRPAGRGAPRIDPKPILDGWKLLESTALYRAQGKNALTAGVSSASIGQMLLMSKEQLAQEVLNNPRIELYSCGRRDIEAGIIDRRVLATLEFLAASGLEPTVTSLTCGHGYYTSSGNVSEHSTGDAVDIAKINGIPILGHQGEGSITDITIRRLLTLQGTMKPHQIISLMTYQGTDNTLALPDHADHIHVGFHPEFQPGTPGSAPLEAVLKPTQWIKLIDRIGHIANPTVSLRPSKYAIRVPVTRASAPHQGE